MTTTRSIIKGDQVVFTLGAIDYTADIASVTITSAENKDASTFAAPYYDYTLKLVGPQMEGTGNLYELLWDEANQGTIVAFTVKASSTGETVTGQARIPWNNPDFGGDERVSAWKQTFTFEVIGKPTRAVI